MGKQRDPNERPPAGQGTGRGDARIEVLERRIQDLTNALGAFSIGPLGGGVPPRPGDLIGLPAVSVPAALPSERRSCNMTGQITGDDRARFVRDHIRQRRLRGDFFPAEFFADPVWDMLLDLYAAYYEGHPVSVSSLCIAAAVPATTALRWIKTLTGCGWFIRARDLSDGRRVYVHLSDEVRLKLDIYFDALQG